jgi:hypothetical protein
MTASDLQQVPLDRVTQTIYARIHAAMKPLRDEVVRVQESGQLLAVAFGKFRESLPALDLSSYNALREHLAAVAEALQEAVLVPFSLPTRGLAAQLIDHDLPRLAAIAVKLNEEEAPKFFAAINYTDSAFETFAVDAKQKTTIRKADFDAAIDQIVNRRLIEIVRLIKEDTAKWLAAQGVTEEPAMMDLCLRNPNQAFLYWQSFVKDLANCPPMGQENEKKFRETCDTFRNWFEGQGHWRALNPNAEDLDPSNHNTHAEHKKQIEDYMTTRKAVLRVIEFDDVKLDHKCQHEGTEHEQVDFQWTYLLAGEPQIIMTVETGNVLPPHNDPLKRKYFKSSVPCGYAVLEDGDRLDGTLFFPNGEYITFTPQFDARFYPESHFLAGDYELRRVESKAVALQPTQSIVSNTDTFGAKQSNGWEDLQIDNVFEPRIMMWNGKPFSIEEPAACFNAYDLENVSLEDYFPELYDNWAEHIGEVPHEEVKDLRRLRLEGMEKTLNIDVMLRDSVPVYPERFESSGDAEGWHEGGVLIVSGKRYQAKGVYIELTETKKRAKFEAARRARESESAKNAIVQIENRSGESNVKGDSTFQSKPLYMLRQGSGHWLFTIDGHDGSIRDCKGLRYVEYLFKNPSEPIHATRLEAEVREVNESKDGVTEIADPNSGKRITLPLNACIQEHNLSCDNRDAKRRIWQLRKELQRIIDDPTVTNMEKDEAQAEKAKLDKVLTSAVFRDKTNAAKSYDRIRQAINRLLGQLDVKKTKDGDKYPAYKALAEHIQQYVMSVSSRYSGKRNSRTRTGTAQTFVYERPAGMVWSD